MARATFCLLLLAFFTRAGPATGKRMVWVSNIDLNNPDSWDPRGAPCRNDHVTFPAKAPPVYVQTNQTLLELVLPNDGEIILAEGSSLTFPETPDSSCVGKNVLFIGVNPKSWFDSVNWCVTIESSIVCLTTQPDLLDTERVPCQSDDVIFSAGTSFYVDLQRDAAIRIASLSLGNEPMNTESFRSYVNSESGRKQFIGQNSSTTVTITGGTVCTDVTGCNCGNLDGSFQSRVCAIQSDRCLHVSCRNAILPEGHCCHICGALLSLDYGAGFKLTNLRNLVTDTFQRHSVSPDGVKTIISKLDNDRIQVVLESTTDDGGGAGQVGRSLKEDLERDPRYGAVRVNLTLSESSSPEAHTGDRSSASMSSGGVVGLIFAILIIVIAILVAVYFYRNRDNCHRPKIPEISLPSPSDFRRFFRQDGARGSDPGFELRQQSVSFDNRIFEANLAGFENPTYGDLFTNLQPTSPIQTIGSEKAGFSNPMYTTTTTEASVESKASPPPDYILYDVPPKEPSSGKAKTRPEVGQATEEKSASGTRDSSEESVKKTDSLGRKLMGPIRSVTSRLRGTTRLEEEEANQDPKEERPAREDASNEEPETEKRRVRVKLGRSNDHERLEEIGEGGDREEDGKKEQKMGRRAAGEAPAGFGNPLYGDEEFGAVVDKDLGEAGTTGSAASASAAERTRRNRTGFENPVFEESKERQQRAEETRSVSVSGATEADEESRA